MTKDDFGKPLPGRTVEVDPREPDVFVRFLAQILKKPGLRCLRCKGPRPDVVEQRAQLLAVHRAKWLEQVDFGPSWTVIWVIGPFSAFISL